MHFADGIAAQPAVLARSRASVSGALPRLGAPEPGQVIGLVGIGASEHAARGAALQWRRAGLRAFGLSAAELSAQDAAAADAYVLISESGRSTETLSVVEHVTGSPTLAVVNDPGSPLARACGQVLHLDSGEDSPVYTTGYTATLQALGLLGEHWSGRTTDWSALPEQAQEVLDTCSDRIEALTDVVQAAQVVDVVSSGTSSAAAGEGALMLRESARLLTAAHETRSYLHGPMEPLDAGVACVVALGDGREVRLAQETAALGCATVLVTTREDVDEADGLTVVRLPRAASPLARAVLEMLPLQVLGWSVAAERGLEVDGFRHHQDDTKSD